MKRHARRSMIAYRSTMLLYALVICAFGYEAFSALTSNVLSNQLDFVAPWMFWFSALAVFVLTYPLVWIMTVVLLAGASSVSLSWLQGFVVRFWSGLPISVLFAFIYSTISPWLPVNEFLELIVVVIILSFCIAPSCYLLSLELLEKSNESQFASFTLGMTAPAYVYSVFLHENKTAIRRVNILGIARAVGEFLVIYQVANVNGPEKVPATVNDVIDAAVSSMTSGDFSLVLILVLFLALFGQTIIGLGGVFLK